MSRLPIVIVVLVIVLIILIGVLAYFRFSSPSNSGSGVTIITPVPVEQTPTVSASPTTSEPGFFSRLFHRGGTQVQSEILHDADSDGLSDEDEQTYGTDPNNPDTDGDSFQDGIEVERGYNPLIAGSGPEAQLDSDHDGLLDPKEKELGTDLHNPDTDGDGFRDGEEVQFGFDPLVPSGTAK